MPSEARPSVGTLSLPQFPQPAPRLIQGRILFAKRKSHLLRPIPPIVVETRSRYRSHSNLFHQIFRERDVVGEPERADVRHHVVCPTRTKATESRFRQGRHQPVAPCPVSIGKIFIVSTRQPQGRRTSFLQRSRSAHGEEIMNFTNRIRDRRRS